MRLASTALVILFIVLPVSAGEVVSARIASGGRILIGDPVTLEIELRHQPGQTYRLRLDPASHFELRGEPEVETLGQDGELSATRYRIKVVPFATGRLLLAPLLLESQTEQLQTPPITVDVGTLTAPQDYEIKEIRLLPRPPASAKVVASFTALLLCAIPFYLVLRYAHRRLQRPAPLPVSPQPAPQPTLEDEAIERLRHLLSSGLALADVKKFHIELSETLTWYLAERFSCHAREWTTSELLHYAEIQGFPQLLRRVYAEVLPQCDLVKFARFQPEQSVSEGAARRAIDLFNTLRTHSGELQR